MYQPKKYTNNQLPFLKTFIRGNPFATIVLNGEMLLATHVPVLAEEGADTFRLYAHIANHNPMRRFLENGTEMLLVFTGAHAYVSSSWYSAPDIPTWDYSAVHVNANIQIQKDHELQESLVKLIDHFEIDQEKPITYRDIPSEIWRENFSEITGFWLNPFNMVGIEKLHQGFEAADVENIKSQLDKRSNCPYHKISIDLKKKHG